MILLEIWLFSLTIIFAAGLMILKRRGPTYQELNSKEYVLLFLTAPVTALLILSLMLFVCAAWAIIKWFYPERMPEFTAAIDKGLGL